jgi:hypothetical protein
MKYTFTLFINFLSLLPFHAQNLVLNSSFERNLEPYCKGWYTACNKELSCDTLGDCSDLIYRDSPGDSTVDQWCLLIYGNTWPFENHVDYYVTGRNGTFIYQMKWWMNTEHMLGYGKLGVLKGGEFIPKDSVVDVSMPWTAYQLEDTLTTASTDTIVVRLASGLGDFCLCDVYFDLVELNVLDSLSTQVDPLFGQTGINVFPNPVTDHLQINGQSLSEGFITIFNEHGQRVVEKRLNNNESVIDLSALSPGIYYYQIRELINNTLVKAGDFLKM